MVGSSDVRMWLGDQYQRILVGITVVWLAFILSADFVVVSGNPFRDYGPRWDAQLRSAAISCATDRLSHVSLSLLFRKYIIVVPCDRITEPRRKRMSAIRAPAPCTDAMHIATVRVTP